jgi:hypothetical protein
MKLFRRASPTAGALAALLLSSLSGPALANNMVVKDATGATITVCSRTQTSVEHPCHVMYGQRPDLSYGSIQTDASGNVVVSGALAVDTELTLLHTDNGAQGTGASFNPPTGGSGVLGYLSGIYKALTGTLSVSVSGAVAATEADGANIAIGSKADAASATGSQTLVSILKQLHADMIAATPAGSAVIGKTTTDQTTPGVTDLIHAASVVTEPSNVPTIPTTAQTSGWVLGGIQQFTSQPTSGNITYAEATFNSGTFAGTIDLFVFNASPTGGGTSNGAPFALTSADTAKLLGVIHMNDLTSLGGALSQVQASGFSIPYKLASGTTLYVVAREKGTPTCAGASDANFTLVVNQ